MEWGISKRDSVLVYGIMCWVVSIWDGVLV